MERRNLKKSEQPNRKPEKREEEDLTKLTEKAIINAMFTEVNVALTQPASDSERKLKGDKNKKPVEIQRNNVPRKHNSIRKVDVDTPRLRHLDTVNVRVAGGDSDKKFKKDKSKVLAAKKHVDIHRSDEQRIDHIVRNNYVEAFKMKPAQPDRGDSDKKTKIDKYRIIPLAKKFDDILRHDEDITKNRNSDIEERRKIRENYTLRTKLPTGVVTTTPLHDVRKELPTALVGNAVRKELPNGVVGNAVRKELPTAVVENAVRKELPNGVVGNAVRKELPTAVVGNAVRKELPNGVVGNAVRKELPTAVVGNAVRKELPNGVVANAVRKELPNGVVGNAVRKEIVNAKRDGAKYIYDGKSNLETSKIVPDLSTKKPSGAMKEKLDSTPPSKDSDKDSQPQKKPFIKTITSKNDATKIYKAVTFVERSKQKPTAIQVKLPDEYKTPKTSETSAITKKVSDTSKESSNFEEEHISKAPKKIRFKNKKSKVKRLITSPDTVVRENSPLTEVAKWAPSCINEHTQPYYEAWVSTTLAAISKTSKKDKLFLEKQHILESFQRALAARPETPDLIYEHLNDERYTGRIKVRQR